MKVHFIAIGGSAMHNLAIALSRKGIEVTGSDDEIFEPSRSRLEKQGVLPDAIGWNVHRIDQSLDAVILGMHAREDNPELQEAKRLAIPIFSYPEYLYEQSKTKKRIVIGGSHGKTTITSMLLHVCKKQNIDVDYMVGAQLEGYDCMVRLTDTSEYMILEGDEYLSSPIDRRPKFHLYKPDVALISGIAWDHINVFPTFENYVLQFDLFCSEIKENGFLIYNSLDNEVERIAHKFKNALNTQAYETPVFKSLNNGTEVTWDSNQYRLQIFGSHNLQNMIGAMHLAKHLDISNAQFLMGMADFTGAGKRLQKVTEQGSFVMYKDFAHSPSKLKATTGAVKEQYGDRKIIACMELHTFSSLRKDFLPFYKDCMNAADHALVYYSPEVVAHKKLDALSVEDVQKAFGDNVVVKNTTASVLEYVYEVTDDNCVLLMMSSGNFDGIDYDALGTELSA
ncbi:Mur ligase family protein [Crocinitomicaceae bacterium]|nr:Mur ligase family protein [Crocinitomicaceae bacterium]MDB4606450.1 Mur ligase family protein [Crocinitomicaceae bacterium]